MFSSRGSAFYDLQMAIVTSNLTRIKEIISPLDAEALAGIRLIGRSTPVSFAIYRNRSDVLTLLLKYEFDLSKLSRDHLGRIEPAICSAVRLGHFQILEILLKKPNILINQCDFFGQTALWLAVRFRRLDMVRLIVAHPNFRTNHKSFYLSRSSPLYLASKYVNRGRQEIFELLLRLGLPFVCCDTDDEIQESYKGWTLGPNLEIRAGFSIFTEIALIHQKADLVTQLLNAGVNVTCLRDLFVSPSMKEMVATLVPRSLFSEVRLLLRRSCLLKTGAPITFALVNRTFPSLPDQLVHRLTQLT